MAKIQVPSIGRQVHYVLPEGRAAGEHRPATIVKIWDPVPAHGSLVQLQVLTDQTNDGYDTGLLWRTSVRYSEEHDPGTWHWPEFVPPIEA